ncbi:MAG: hypothetical protein ACYC4L_18475 [Chloroflexota bacterium]
MDKKQVRKRLRVDITSEQSSKLREEVFSNVRLTDVERRKAVRRALTLPTDGSHVELYCNGQSIGAV